MRQAFIYLVKDGDGSLRVKTSRILCA